MFLKLHLISIVYFCFLPNSSDLSLWDVVVLVSYQGSCISGIIGNKILKFCLFGDMVSTAAEMEKRGTPDCIHASQDLVDLVPEEAWQNNSIRKNKNDSAKKQTYLLCI